jgi:hypothetical protein
MLGPNLIGIGLKDREISFFARANRSNLGTFEIRSKCALKLLSSRALSEGPFLAEAV